MISSLLTNRGLRLQLLVGLLLVLGTPVPSEVATDFGCLCASTCVGLKCYECKDPYPVPASKCTKTTTCEPGEDYCYSEVTATATSDNKGVNKACLRSDFAECFKKKFDSSCKKTTDWMNAGDLQEDAYHSCFSEKRVQKERKKEETFEYFSMCVCDSDLCNTGNSGGHSKSVIIFAILSVGFYNYI